MVKPKTKRLLCELTDYCCELCKKKFDLKELEIHRLRRGNMGGTYTHRNCMVLCKKCFTKLGKPILKQLKQEVRNSSKP